MKTAEVAGFVRKTAAAVICFIVLFCFSFSDISSASEYMLPDRPGYGAMKWGVKIGSDWQDAPTPPALHGDSLYIASGKRLLKIDKKTGDREQICELSESMSWGICSPVYSAGVIFAGIDGGRVQAVDLSDSQSLWISDGISEDSYAQIVTPVTVSGNYVFAGTCSFDTRGGTYGSFACLDRKTGKILWTENSDSAGFYNSEACVIGDYVLFGSDAETESGKSRVCAVKYKEYKGDGEYSVLPGIEGNIRSGITAEGKGGSDYDIFFTSQSGKLYRAGFDSAAGSFSGDIDTCDLGAVSTSTPQMSGRYLVVGADDRCIHFIDKYNMQETVKEKTPGYPQGDILLETEGDKLYAYSTYNELPGGIYLTVIDVSEEKPVIVDKGDLFIPDKKMQNYCMSPVIADEDGTIYYKNDSGYLMAVMPGYTIKASSSEGGIKPETVIAGAGETVSFSIKPDKGYMTADIKVDGKSKGTRKVYEFTGINDNHTLHVVYLKKKTDGFTAVKRTSKNKMLLKWKKKDGASGYIIYRISGGKYKKLSDVSASQTSYTVKGVKKNGTKYRFALRGYYRNTDKKKIFSEYSKAVIVK